MRSIVSRTPSPGGTSSVKNRPMTSPSRAHISSPTITWKGAISCTARAPRIVSWSVTATQVIPLR